MRLIPALQDLYRDTHHFIVVQKAAQVFISEYLVNVALWTADTGQGGRGNALFIMPTQSLVDDFSQARFDKAISESPYLKDRLFPPPPGRPGPARQQLKKVGQGYIYLRGADRRKLSSVDADVVLCDEYDLMDEGVLHLAQKRLASSRLGWLRVASTPRLPEAGINDLFLQSDQRYYFLKCPGCGLAQRLEWDANVDQKRYLVVCRREGCRKPMDVWSPGHWEATSPGNSDIHGYHINRLYSPRANIRQMVYEGEATTPFALQEFQNAVLGETFVPPGGRISLDTLDRCRREYLMPQGSEERTYMGVDVGIKLHVVIRQSLQDDGARALFIGQVDSFEELDGLIERYGVRVCVMDALPETHKARSFAKKWSRKVWLAYYDRSEGDHQWDGGVGSAERVLHVNRTLALDETFDRFQKGQAELPSNARLLGGRVQSGIGEYYREMMALNRALEHNAQGNLVYRYSNEKKDDHYAHAEVYCLLASGPGARPGGRIGRIRRF